MTYEKDPFEFENIPDFALQPARGAEEYNNQFLPKGGAGRFDATAYEEILKGFAKEKEEPEESGPDTLEAAPVETEVEAENPVEDVFEEILEPAITPEDIAEDADLETSVEAQEPMETTDEDIALNPETIPVSKPMPAPSPKPAPIKIIPVSSAVNSKLKLVDIKKIPQVRIYIEEDILVPDIKPDLASVISMEGNVKLNQREVHASQGGSVKVSGDLVLQTLYIPEVLVDGERVISIDSKIPFKNEIEINAGDLSDLIMTAFVESVDYTVINERKFKVRATLALKIREYNKVDIEIFEGIRDEEVQMLKERILLTDVALRKKESIEVKEDLSLKENMPDIEKILKYDVNVTENHKQITKEKAVVNASVYCNIMYLAKDVGPKAADEDGLSEGESTPVLYQGKTEFTQFIRLDGEDGSEGQNPAGSRIGFDISSLSLTAKEDGNGKKNIIELEMNVDTHLELYKNVEKEVVTDVYHHLKDLQYDTQDINLTSVSGSGVAEISVREIVNIPEKYGNVERIAYISGKIGEKTSIIDQGKNIVEGNVAFNLICVSADDKKSVFCISQDIPFRSSMEIPGITADMVADNDMMLKELWIDKINNRQIEVNAGILMNTTVSKEENHKLVRNVNFLETPADGYRNPGIIVYITKAGDNLWKIAKKYRTTIDEIQKVNELGSAKDVKPGTKLLIVSKNH